MDSIDKKLIKTIKDKVYKQLEDFINKNGSRLKINSDELQEIDYLIVKNRYNEITSEMNKYNKTITLYVEDKNSKGIMQSTYDIFKK